MEKAWLSEIAIQEDEHWPLGARVGKSFPPITSLQLQDAVGPGACVYDTHPFSLPKTKAGAQSGWDRHHEDLPHHTSGNSSQEGFVSLEPSSQSPGNRSWGPGIYATFLPIDFVHHARLLAVSKAATVPNFALIPKGEHNHPKGPEHSRVQALWWGASTLVKGCLSGSPNPSITYKTIRGHL